MNHDSSESPPSGPTDDSPGSITVSTTQNADDMTGGVALSLAENSIAAQDEEQAHESSTDESSETDEGSEPSQEHGDITDGYGGLTDLVEEGTDDFDNIAFQEYITSVMGGAPMADMSISLQATAEFLGTDMPMQDQDTPLASSVSVPHPPIVGVFQLYGTSDLHHTCFGFLRSWVQCRRSRGSLISPISEYTAIQTTASRPDKIKKDAPDIQGLDWKRFGTDRKTARRVRRTMVKNHRHMGQSSYQVDNNFGTEAYAVNFKSDESPGISQKASFFRFNHTTTTRIPYFRHPQLRHTLSAISKDVIFYLGGMATAKDDSGSKAPHPWNIRRFHAPSGNADVVLDAGKLKDAVACLTAEHGILTAGTLNNGSYRIKSLQVDAQSEAVSGMLNDSMIDGEGVNHVENYLHRRSGLVQAAFCTNDNYIRVVDCETNRIVQASKFPRPVNCSAMNPDGRLRLLVSDDPFPLVADAENGSILAQLPGHRDHGFACAWSPDGITMATGHQDGHVRIWDARNWATSVHTLPAEMTSVRSLTFSPLGSGHPVLVMAENVDFVSVVDARTFLRKQDLDSFGEIAGVAMPKNDRVLIVGNSDPVYGGILQYERTGEGRSYNTWTTGSSIVQGHEWRGTHATGVPRATTSDWLPEDELDHDPHVRLSRTQRRRRHLGLGHLMI